MKKQIGIMEEVYDNLKRFRDKNYFPSFTEAIRELLRLHGGGLMTEETSGGVLIIRRVITPVKHEPITVTH